MVSKYSTKKRVGPTIKEAQEFAKTGINGWCLRHLKGTWCVHEVMKYFDEGNYPEYHLLVDNYDDLQTVEKYLLAIVPASHMVKPFLTNKLLQRDMGEQI